MAACRRVLAIGALLMMPLLAASRVTAAGPAEEKPATQAEVAPPTAAATVSVPPPAASTGPTEAPADTQAIFRVRTNVVTVRAVVRDGHGRVVGDVRKEEFELLDKGKRQVISSFSVERPTPADRRPALTEHAADSGSTGDSGGVREAVPVASRFVLYVMDDLGLKFEDLSQTRTAAERVLQDSAGPAARVAVLATSGRVVLDFTADPTEVSKALDRIVPQGLAAQPVQCPDVSPYLAWRIVDLDDEWALGFATAEAIQCGLRTNPKPAARMAAHQVREESKAETRAVLAAIKAAARRMSIMPGARTLVLVSPGFITPELESDLNDVIDRAARAGVVINTLDARGVWVSPGYDAATRSRSPGTDRAKRQYDEEEQQLQSGVLKQLADGTGGIAVQGNGFEEGFRRLTAAPEVSYVLGFTPSELKPDGKYHKLKVTVGTRKGLTVQARNGYFAPKHDVTPAEQAKEEIENAVLSRDEIHDIPATLRAQAAQGKLIVTAHFDLRGIRFVHENGRSRSSLTATVCLFDATGNYLKGVQDPIDLDLADDKLAPAMASGHEVSTGFDAPRGNYMVRLVLRDNDGHMSSMSKLVEVP
jgi:VWFA-related protein